MAQVIKIKRGGIASLVSSTPTLQQGELLLATGSVNGLTATFFVADATNSPELPYSKIETISNGGALAASLDGNFEGLLIHSASDNKLYRYNGTTFVELPIAAGSFEGTLPVANGGTNATSFADKAVIISQDSGTDTLSALTLTTSGQLVIGGSSGPAAATLTAGAGIDVTNGDGSITIAGETASDTNAGIVELATIAETTTGTDATRAVTPDGLKDGYQGSTNVTTLGTISTGTWQGTAIASAYIGSHTHAASDITEISNLTADEGAQLENINSVTISNTQWGYLGASNQGIATSDSPTFAGLTVTGDVSVQGSLTTVNSNEVNLGDRIITLNTANGAGDAGIQVHDTSTAETGSLLWDTDGNYWKVGVSGSTDYRLVEWDGETAGTSDFIHTDSNGRINAINTTTDGDILVSNGAGTFTATNVIDGGTF